MKNNKLKLHFYYNPFSGAFSFPFFIDQENNSESYFGDAFDSVVTDPIVKKIEEIYPKCRSLLMIVSIDEDNSYVISDDSKDFEPKEELIQMVRDILRKLL